MSNAHEVRRRRLPSAAPFIVVADDGSGSTAHALHAPIVTRGGNTPSMASRAARFFARMGIVAVRGRYLGVFWPCSVRLVTFHVSGVGVIRAA